MTRQLAITLDIAGEASKQGLNGASLHNSSDGGFSVFFGGMVSAAMTIAAVLVFAFLVWGGIEWITSSGDKSKMEGARNKISNAVIGLVILAATTAVFMLLQQFLGITVLTFK